MGNRSWPVVIGLVAAAFVGGAAVGRVSFATSRDESPYAGIEQFGRVLTLIENHYVDPVDRKRTLEGAVKGLVRDLDPHSSFMPPEDYRLFKSDTEGKFGGVGVEVDLRDELITVIAPIEGSPAHRAGIRSGDKIIAIDGHPARGEPIDKLVRKLRGAPGTSVEVAVRRAGSESPLLFRLVREEIKVTSVVARRLANDVLHLRIKQFQQGTHDELLRTVGRVRAESGAPLVGVLLDMRNNPGGLVDQAAEIADEFLDGGAIYSTRHRGQVVDEVRASGGGALSRLPVAVIVNEYSASAAELVAGAMQDNHRANVVGAQTFGKGSVQSILELPGGSGLRLTTMRYYTPNGRSIQAQGIAPDVAVESIRPAGDPLGVTRERDLEGHLPAEAVHDHPDGRRAGPVYFSDGGAPSSKPEAPADPTRGDDLALSIAYQIVRGTFAPAKK
jgi:carboxyl-terminal processing protease